MPCMCHYDPSEESKKFLKDHCVAIVAKVKELRKEGDPRGCEIEDIHTLIDHLYYPKKCNEKDKKHE